MKFKIALTIAGIVWLGLRETSGQIYSYPEEALTLSRTQAGGTARIRAMGGAQNALGGDLSSAFYNPAGLGMYNRSELSLSPGYSVAGSTADYLGNSTDASKGNVMVPNRGVAFHSDKDGTKGLWGGTFAVNFNRINDFNSTFSYKGTNSVNSIIDYFINAANGTDSTQFQSGTSTRPEGYNYNTPVGLAYNNYLIGPLSDFTAGGSKIIYDSPVPYQPTVQDETIKTSGAQNQWSFSY
ncbi:MAG TPA: hypothetical protein PLR06_11940, partial [Cyclobacteriaceae bacterium]|nr:hypothetical protein [Cyclobacteriaceae bacterium]